ncbi:fumarylacetoacetate hydrolase family protein [Streptomyces sp. SID8352]|uniref:fumarylacetoacetate hydrolase family protein n=1 Tax=Streptomyces sp. SID8352 TaxID=2690338 RepID=UPI00137151B4|nr:fumarylacetoacetate hydrolase family protein [Streptomyces sp. SID8352]MYU26205.1 FAA hydrolase family protein [Streptomyces sp. SID8352]
MRLATLRTTDGTVAARLDGDTFTEIPGCTDIGALLLNEDWRRRAADADGRRVPAAGAGLGLLVPNPSKVLCTGLNYTSHIEEMGRGLPSHPTLFAKFADTLTGPTDPVSAAPEDPEMDWEGELAVVVGRTAYRVDEDEAAECIAGYTIANDISMRGWQNRTTEWLQGKIWARSTPVGPVLTTPDAFDPATATLSTTVNGKTVQEHAIADLLFTPTRLIAYISTMLPLRPGDLILTGTPGGVGRARTPRWYLTPGDVVEVTIDGIGTLTNPII